TRFSRDWSSDVCSSDLARVFSPRLAAERERGTPRLVATARCADSLRSSALAFALLVRPDPPARSPPPDCLLTVAQARASASCSRSEERRVGKGVSSRWL